MMTKELAPQLAKIKEELMAKMKEPVEAKQDDGWTTTVIISVYAPPSPIELRFPFSLTPLHRLVAVIACLVVSRGMPQVQ